MEHLFSLRPITYSQPNQERVAQQQADPVGRFQHQSLERGYTAEHSGGTSASHESYLREIIVEHPMKELFCLIRCQTSRAQSVSMTVSVPSQSRTRHTVGAPFMWIRVQRRFAISREFSQSAAAKVRDATAIASLALFLISRAPLSSEEVLFPPRQEARP